MKFRIPGVIVLAFAVLSACIGPGCSNTTNESGSGASGSQGPAPPGAPKTQEEFFKQQMEKAAAAKKAPRPSR